MSSGGSGPSLPATPDTFSSSQQQAISRPSRPFSPSPPKETRHTASRPVSLYLGRALPSASVSTPNLSAFDFSSIGGASGLPRREEGYRSIYDGLAKHEPQGEDVFGFGERRSRKGSRVGQPGEVDRTTATAELAIPRGNLEMMRSRSSDSSTSSASPPLGSTSILAALAASDPLVTPDLPSPSSPGPRSPRYSLPAEHYPGSPASHHSARSSRTSYSHSFYGQSSKSMPRLHQPTVVRSTSGRGVSFVPPPAKLASSSSSSTLAQPRASRASMPPQSRLWSPDIADDDAGSPLSGIGGASSIGGMSRATSYFGELGAPIAFPPPAKAYTGSVDAVDVEGSIEQRHVIRVNQGKEIDTPAQERPVDEMDQDIRDGKHETVQNGVDQPDIVPPVTLDGSADPEVADREPSGIAGLGEDLNVAEQELCQDRRGAAGGDGDGLESTKSAGTASEGEGEEGATENSRVDRSEDVVVHEQDTSSDTPSNDPESDVSAAEGDVFGDVGATLAVEEADRQSAEFVPGAKGDEEIERAKPEEPVDFTATMRNSEAIAQQIDSGEPAQDQRTATTLETSAPVDTDGPAEATEASDLGLAASAAESEIDNGDTGAVAEDDMSSVEITSSNNRDDPHSLDSKCEGGPAIAEDRVQAPSEIDGAIVDTDATEPAPWGTVTTTPIPATPDQREAMRGEKIDKEQQPEPQSDFQSAVETTGTSSDAGHRATEDSDALRDSFTPTDDVVEAVLPGDAMLRQDEDSGRADQALSDKSVHSVLAPVEVPSTDNLEIEAVGGRSGQTTPSLPTTPVVHAADEQISIATSSKFAAISELPRSTLPSGGGTADIEQPNLARETDLAGLFDPPARTADSYNIQPTAPPVAQQESADSEISGATEHLAALPGTSSHDVGDDQIGTRTRPEVQADDNALTKPRDKELDDLPDHYIASPLPSESAILPVFASYLKAEAISTEQAGEEAEVRSIEVGEPESTPFKAEAEQRPAAMPVIVIPGADTVEEVTLHEVEERQIRQAPLAPAAKPADPPAAPDAPAPMQTATYIPPYKARRPSSTRTYHLSPPVQGSNAEDNHIAFTVLAGISRQSHTDPLSLTIPHLELHLAWNEPKTWLWVPARRYIPDLALSYVPRGKEVMLSTPEDRARTTETERQRGMARAIIGGVIGRLPVVWRLAGWI